MDGQKPRHELVHVPDDDEPSGTDSPSKRFKHVDPDRELDRMLQEQSMFPDHVNETNSLLRSLKDSVGQVGQLASVVTSLAKRVEQSEADNDKNNSRLDRMEHEISRLAGLLEQQPRAGVPPRDQKTHPERERKPHTTASSSMTDPWARYRPPASPSQPVRPQDQAAASPTKSTGGNDDTNYCHLVFGGWERDCRRAVIDGDMRPLIADMGLDNAKLQIYGQRSSTAHYLLPEIGFQESKVRFYELQSRWSKERTTSKGVHIWIAPARTQARRHRNRMTRDGLTRIEAAVGPDLVHEIETDWGRQLVWVKDRRVLATSQHDLFAEEDERTCLVAYRENKGETLEYHINLTVLSGITGLTIAQLEPRVYSI